MKTYSIQITGIVQGVGFRPFVYQTAIQEGWKGSVSNGLDGVRIVLNANDLEEAKRILSIVLDGAPKLSMVENSEIEEISNESFEEFRIIESCDTGSTTIPLTPDYALCQDCRNEIRSPKDRRYAYGFTTCTNCGPRYSITESLPYDRERTTMESYLQCPICSDEYNNPLDRRHYSQTNSCSDCGILLNLIDLSTGAEIKEMNLIDQVARQIEEGHIVAVKGIGGFLLMCDAKNDTTLLKLRNRKHRPSKPLAVMYPDIEQVECWYELGNEERDMLLSSQSPIVLLHKSKRSNLAESVAPGLNSIGVMLPYAPLLQLIIDRVGKPLVATSANLSGSPIIYRNGDIHQLDSVADYVLLHDRAILIPQDDSVVRFTSKYKQQIILRRSRGWAPNYLLAKDSLKAIDGTFATGAQMKSAFSFVEKGRCYTSQYLGNLDSWHSQEVYQKVVDHLFKVTGFSPKITLKDQHPAYFGNEIAGTLHAEYLSETESYHHHRAHFAALLGEKNLLESKQAVLGFVWDGTGLGEDGKIWGSESFTYQNGEINHLENLGYFPVISGDKMSLDPRLSLLSIRHTLGHEPATFSSSFSETEFKVFVKQIENSVFSTSSMGRLFDAVYCLLTGISNNSFEGAAAMCLEAMAIKPDDFDFPDIQYEPQPLGALFNQVMNWYSQGVTAPRIAWLFHYTLTDWVEHQAKKYNCQHLAFSGGVFQNALLVDLIIEKLSDNFSLNFHLELSPNDENIAFGQLMLHLLSQRYDGPSNCNE